MNLWKQVTIYFVLFYLWPFKKFHACRESSKTFNVTSTPFDCQVFKNALANVTVPIGAAFDAKINVGVFAEVVMEVLNGVSEINFKSCVSFKWTIRKVCTTDCMNLFLKEQCSITATIVAEVCATESQTCRRTRFGIFPYLFKFYENIKFWWFKIESL